MEEHRAGHTRLAMVDWREGGEGAGEEMERGGKEREKRMEGEKFCRRRGGGGGVRGG